MSGSAGTPRPAAPHEREALGELLAELFEQHGQHPRFLLAPDAVIRTIADLGPSDGRWVTLYSCLAEGDEVVVDGVYQLKLATSGQTIEAGHFHSDGTFHEGDD